MDHFVNNPCLFYGVITIVCNHLSFHELKNLSLVSKEWFQSTSSAIVKRCMFKVKVINVRSIRHYKKFHLQGENDVGTIFRALQNSIREKQLLDPTRKFDVDIIFLDFCDLSSADIRSVWNFSNLRLPRIEIFACRFEDDGDIIIEGLKLEALTVYLRSNQEQDLGSLIDSSKHSMKSLYLEKAPADLLDRLKITNLEKFGLWRTDNFQKLDTFLQNHPRLIDCDFQGLCLPEFIFKTIARYLQKLKILKFYGDADITGYSLVAVRNLQYLENLQIYGMSLPASHLTEIGTSKLKTLDLFQLKTTLTFQDFGKFFKNMPNLTELSLEYCRNNIITGQVVTLISKSFLNLEVLNLGGNDLRSEVSSSRNIFNKLRKLYLYHSKINDDFLKSIQAGKLIELVAHVDTVSSDSIQEFILTSPRIKKLCLRKCLLLDDQGTSEIVKNLIFLEQFEMDSCYNLTIESVRSILIGRFIREAYLTANVSVEELNKICTNRDFILKHNKTSTEITNAFRRIKVGRYLQ